MIIVCKCGKRRTAAPWKDAREKKVDKCLACSPTPRQVQIAKVSIGLKELRSKVMLKDRNSTCGPKSGNVKR